MPEQTSNPDATLAQYADGPAQLEAVLIGMTEADLNLAQTPDTWLTVTGIFSKMNRL